MKIGSKKGNKVMTVFTVCSAMITKICSGSRTTEPN